MKVRRLTVDVEPLLAEQWTGIPVFTQRLIAALHREGSVDLTFCVGEQQVAEKAVLTAVRSGSSVALREDQARVPKQRIRKCEHLLVPTVKRVFGRARHEASVVHDLSSLYMPDEHEHQNVLYHTEFFLKEVETDDVVFCASQATRAALVRAYPSAAHKARVLYQYVEWPEDFEELDRNGPAIQLWRYALVVGTLEPRKNLSLMLRALAKREVIESDLRFVVIGGKGWKMDTFMNDLTASQRARITFTGYVSEFVKYQLIRHAQFLVYPSLYEGFGIPALEALSLGKPVLAARTSSFPEVVGDAGLYFDPLSVRELVAALAEIQRPRMLEALGRRALARCRCFDWRRMAASVLDWLNR